ncbi:unnamed protein product [marine sediment metagenome]|uniref:Uncharacterized protein n=1 Tax=marine sediment metagenome TaxID=412755 RepID=X1J8L5_9ZZZZ
MANGYNKFFDSNSPFFIGDKKNETDETNEQPDTKKIQNTNSKAK